MDFIKDFIDVPQIVEDVKKNPLSWITVILFVCGITAYGTYCIVEKWNDKQIQEKEATIENLKERNQGLQENKKDLESKISKTPNTLKEKEKHSFSPFHKYFNFVKGHSGVDFWIPTAQKNISQFQSIKLYIIFDKPYTSFELCIYDGADEHKCEEINYQMGMKNNINSNERIISLPLKKFSVDHSDIKKITFHVKKDNKKQEDNGFSVTKVDFE